jgi:hypothetical protein
LIELNRAELRLRPNRKEDTNMPTNQQRAASAEQSIASYGNDLPESNLTDFLTDAMHWCDCTGHDFHIALARACRHYINELNDDQQDERRMS